MLDRIQSFYGFTCMPFGRDLAPGMLHRHGDHAQATARIAYGIDTRGITVITGEVGVGKTVAARAALDRVDRARHHLIYIPDPTVGARGVYHHIVTALGGKPTFHTAALIPQARGALAAEASERGRTPILILDEAHLFTHGGLEAVRLLTLCRDSDYAGWSPGVRWRPRSRMSGERHNHRPSRNARSLSGGRYLPVFVVCDGVRARAFSLSLRSAWMYGCVDRGLSCPIQSAMVTGSTPACNSAIAAECRLCGISHNRHYVDGRVMWP
jgi:AAA domain